MKVLKEDKRKAETYAEKFNSKKIKVSKTGNEENMQKENSEKK